MPKGVLKNHEGRPALARVSHLMNHVDHLSPVGSHQLCPRLQDHQGLTSFHPFSPLHVDSGDDSLKGTDRSGSHSMPNPQVGLHAGIQAQGLVKGTTRG